MTLGLVVLALAAAPAPNAAREADVAALLALHEKVLAAHRANDVDALFAASAEDYVVANRGSISRPTLAERKERLGPYLRSTRFEVYRDMVPPVVRVSHDGTLGWVIVQVEARGQQTTPAGKVEPLAFQSAWIELYEKRGGQWIRVGNVSNFKETS